MSRAAPHVEIVVSGHAASASDQASISSQLAGRRFVVWLPLALTAVFFIATRCWVLAAFEPTPTDIVHYQESARRGIDCGWVPYRDFLMEYPPVAYWVMTVPRLIDRQSYAGDRGSPEAIQALTVHYGRWFRAEMLVADVICFGLLLWLAGRQLPRAAWVPPAAYAALTIAQPHLIYDRLDLGLLALILLALACWLRSLRSVHANLWACGAYLALGLGISFKLIPLVMVPFLLLADFQALGLGRQLLSRVATMLIAALGPFLSYAHVASTGILSMFRYHSERGIHIESLWGSILLAAARFGVPCKIKFEYGGYDVLGDWTAALKIGSLLALPVTVGLLLLWSVLNRRRFSHRLAIDAALVAVIDSAAVSHVFSPQYLNWILPLALVAGLALLPRRPAPWCVAAALSLIVLGITTWLYPGHYAGFVLGTDVTANWLAIGRSACLVALVGMLSGHLLLRIRTAGPVDPRPLAERIRLDPTHNGLAKKRRGRATALVGSS